SWTSSWPSPASRARSDEPRKPDAPASTIFMPPYCPAAATTAGVARVERGTLAQLRLEVRFLEALLDRRQEPGLVGAVDQSVGVRQGQVDHLPHRDRLAEPGVGDHDRALDHRARPEDRDLRLVDDRGIEQGATATGVGERERAAGQLIGADLVVAGPRSEVGD